GVLLLLFLIWLYYCWSSILLVFVPFMASLLLAYLLSPVVLFMEQRGISRPLAIAVIYLVFAIVVFVIWVRVVPMLLDELQGLANELPGYMQQLHSSLNRFQDNYQQFNLPPDIRELVDKNLDGLGEAVTARLDDLFQSAFEVLSGTLLLLLVPVLTYYFLRDERYLKRSLIRLVPKNYKQRFLFMARDINRSLGAFLRGSLLVSLAVGLLTCISFLIIGLNFPLVLACLIGLTNLIPIAGPVIGALPALLIALLQSPFQMLKVLIIVIAIQQVESQLIYPLIIGRSIGFHPLTIIFALLFAGKMLGFAGLILALPVMIVLRIFLQHLWRHS
ncbi:MAG TPA: AI-2E family transporter, partial [Firmicutes bacterium]|nr:AI-2E family transporter [Bacillota bacterium]